MTLIDANGWSVTFPDSLNLTVEGEWHEARNESSGEAG